MAESTDTTSCVVTGVSRRNVPVCRMRQRRVQLDSKVQLWHWMVNLTGVVEFFGMRVCRDFIATNSYSDILLNALEGRASSRPKRTL